MTRHIKPRFGVKYAGLDDGKDKGFAYFNSLADAERFRDLLTQEEGHAFSVIDFKDPK